jgi:endoglycosylceramidase
MKYMKNRLRQLLLVALAIGGAFTAATEAAAEDPATACLLDERGRHLIPGGYVALENIRYTPDDYRRMVRMGANFQVIRMPIGMIGAWPGKEADEKTLAHFDDLVRFGKAAGMRTIFKLVFYGVTPFGDQQWDRVWNNTDGTQEKIIEGWTRIWNRYKDEPSVFGYDLLNEPARGLSDDHERTQREQMLPLLRRMTDAMHKISPEKWAIYQPLLRKPEDQKTKHRDPVVPIEEPFGRDGIIYAPHLYQMDLAVIKPMLDNLERQAAISKAPLLLGEWGPPTRANTDGNPAEEARFTKVYQVTANELDNRGIGGIKAWFCGARKPIPVKGSTNWMTWAIFSDNSAAGRVERHYITDVLARPRPLVVAGRLQHYGNDFVSLRFEMTLQTDPALGATEIFVSADRHYPRGFRVEVGSGLTLAQDAKATALHTVHAVNSTDREQAKQIRWDDDRQRLIIEKWVGNAQKLTVRVLPGVLE